MTAERNARPEAASLPALAVALYAFLLGCATGAALRYTARIPTWLAVGVGCAAAVALLVRLRSRLVLKSAVSVAIVCVGAFAVWALYVRSTGGLIALNCGDGGEHVERMLTFFREPHVYNGHVAFYGLVYPTYLLTRSAFWSFAVAYYASVVAIAIAPLVVMHSAGMLERRRAVVAATIACVVAVLVVSLPILHYLQGDGFYTVVAAAVPVFAMWLFDATSERVEIALAGVIACVVVVRFSHAGVLPDVLVVGGAVCFVRAREMARLGTRWRLVPYVAGLCLVAASVVVFVVTRYYYDLYGWHVPFVRTPYLAGAAVAVVAMLVGAFAASSVRSSLRVPIALTLAGTARFVLFVWVVKPQETYAYYRCVYPTMLVAAGGAAVVIVAALTRRAERRGATAVAGVVACGALVLLATAVEPQRRTFIDALRGRITTELRPVYDFGAERHIRRVLHERNKSFGGYLVSFYPLSNMMNASLGFWNGGDLFYFKKEPPDSSPGHCVFWSAAPDDRHWPRWSFPHAATRARLDATPARTCTSYRASWDPDEVRTLCWLCY